METRDILNWRGDVVGHMSLPEGTAEEVWAYRLAPYAVAPAPTPALAEVVKGRILSAMDFGKDLIATYGTQNVLAGRTSSDIRTLILKLQTLQLLLMSGSLYSALAELQNIQPDSLVTQQDLDTFASRIRAYLGI